MSGLRVLIMLVLASSVPAAAAYCWFRAARYRFSTVRFLLTLLAGAAAFLPALVMQNFFPAEFSGGGKWGMLGNIFLRIALTEELSRLLVIAGFFRILRRVGRGQRGGDVNAGTDIFSGGELAAHNGSAASYGEVIRASAAGLVAGLGFAILESAAYGAGSTGVILLRLFTAAPLHSACGARVGAAAVMFRSHPVQAVFRFFAAVAIHGIYNAMIVIAGLPALAAVVIALSALVSSILSIHGGMSPRGKSGEQPS